MKILIEVADAAKIAQINVIGFPVVGGLYAQGYRATILEVDGVSVLEKPKRRKTIVQHIVNGKTVRWCIKCGVHLDEKGEIDLDYYTARRYLKFLAVPAEIRCDHSCDRLDAKEQLLKKVEVSSIRYILREIIRRLP